MDEIAYEELTITRKDVVTGKETTITGKVKNVEMVMVSEPTQYLDIGIPGESHQFPIPPETIKVLFAAEWVKDHDMFYLLTILDEPIDTTEQ